jgi:hypothetical protein
MKTCHGLSHPPARSVVMLLSMSYIDTFQRNGQPILFLEVFARSFKWPKNQGRRADRLSTFDLNGMSYEETHR